MALKLLAASSSDQPGVRRAFLRTLIHPGGLGGLVRLGVELNAAAPPQLRRALRRARRASRVVLDLRDCPTSSHADVPGVQVIVDEVNRARSENRRLILLRAPLPIDLVFAAIGGSQVPDVIELASTEPTAQAQLALPLKDQAA